MSQIRGSFLPVSGTKTGAMSARQMSVDVVLQPANESALNALLDGQYTRGSSNYDRWIAKGQFDAKFAPSKATVRSMTAYLQSKGLRVQQTVTPFLLRAVGSSTQIETAFATTINNYRSAKGVRFYSNSKPASVPVTLASHVLGVVGLTNTVRLQPTYQLGAASKAAKGRKGKHSSEPSC